MIKMTQCSRIVDGSLKSRLTDEDEDALEASGMKLIRITDQHGNLTRGVLICSHCFGNDEGMPSFGLAVTTKGVAAVEHNNDDIWRYIYI